MKASNRSAGLAALGCFLFLAGGSAHAQTPQPPASIPLPAGAAAWKLIFNDNFDGATYDTSRWNPYADWGGNGSFNNGREKYYTSQIRQSGGICNLVAEPNPNATAFTDSYRSGELISARANTNANTPYKFSFLYGYVEARLKIVNVSGFFGAFWMIPSKKNFTYEWEIDILEVLGHDHRTMFQTYHYRPGLPLDQDRNTSWTPNKGTGSNGTAPVLDYSTGYHTYGVDWQSDHLTFYIDGIASGTFPTPGAGNGNIANTPGYILIQQMVENNWIRSTGHLLPDSTASVDTFHVDYVRVWQGAAGSAIDAGLPAAEGKSWVEVSPNPAIGGVKFVPAPQYRHEAVSVTIFDLKSRVVRRLSARDPVWDGMNGEGERVGAGLYFYSVSCKDLTQTGKLMRVR